MQSNLVLAVLATLASFCLGIKGQIESCPGWRLNKLPEVKSFLKEVGNVDTYKDITLKWTPGMSPKLTIFDDSGTTLEVIDLVKYNKKELHVLLQTKGFSQKSDQKLNQ